MAFVSDERNCAAFGGKPPCLSVNLVDQRTTQIDDIDTAPRSRRPNLGRNTMRAERQPRAVRYILRVVDENDTSLFEVRHDHAVVNDLVVAVNGRAETFNHLLQAPDGHLHAGTKAPRR